MRRGATQVFPRHIGPFTASHSLPRLGTGVPVETRLLSPFLPPVAARGGSEIPPYQCLRDMMPSLQSIPHILYDTSRDTWLR
jgi:hypothetical protein